MVKEGDVYFKGAEWFWVRAINSSEVILEVRNTKMLCIEEWESLKQLYIPANEVSKLLYGKD